MSATKHPRLTDHFGWLLAACLLAVGSGSALADGNVDIEEALEDRDADLEEGAYLHLGEGLLAKVLRPYDEFREQTEKDIGLNWLIAGSYLYQSRTHGGRNKTTNNFELDALFDWDLVDSETFGEGSLSGLFSRVWELRNASKTAEVTESAGTAFPISDSDKVEALRQFYWKQSLLNERVDILLGQLEFINFTDDNTYANNDRSAFVSETWLKTTRSGVNVFGLGAATIIRPTDLFYVSGGIIDGNFTDDGPRPSSFLRGEYIYYGEFGLTPNFEGFGKGIYRISPYWADKAREGRKQGSGVSISFEQETPWPGKPALFLRGGVSNHRRNNFESFLGGGVVFTEPFGFNRDWLGLAFGWGKPDNGEARANTYLFETFWRMQLTERLDFGPTIQLHFNPAENRNRDMVAVNGFRLNIKM